MNQPPFDLETAHRWFAVELNNATWDILENPQATQAEQQQAVHMAHASCFHWYQLGTLVNKVRAICLLANAEAAFGSPEAACRFSLAAATLAGNDADPRELTDWDLAFIDDARARASAAAGRTEDALRQRKSARQLGDAIADPDDKQIFDRWFAAGDWHGLI